MEAGLTLREVEDVVFSNTRTLEFFNNADRKQVQYLLGRVNTYTTWVVESIELN